MFSESAGSEVQNEKCESVRKESGWSAVYAMLMGIELPEQK